MVVWLRILGGLFLLFLVCGCITSQIEETTTIRTPEPAVSSTTLTPTTSTVCYIIRKGESIKEVPPNACYIIADEEEQKSLSYCDHFEGGERDECYTEIARLNQDIRLCNKIEVKKSKYVCKYGLTLILLRDRNITVEKALEFCEEMGEADIRDFPESLCIKSVAVVSDQPLLNQDAGKQITQEADLKEVRSCWTESFEFEDKKIDLVEISYGPPQDCFSGCFHSSFGGIIENGESFQICNFNYNAEGNNLQLYPKPQILAGLVDSMQIYSNVSFGGGYNYYRTFSDCFIRYMHEINLTEDFCSNLSDEGEKQTCFDLLIVDQKKYEDCDKIYLPRLRDHCFLLSAFKSKEINKCGGISDLGTREYCINTLD
ncbi:MAG: hypothetical protein V1744_06410 [Candidatus Altiarchaeota archaeon]